VAAQSSTLAVNAQLLDTGLGVLLLARTTTAQDDADHILALANRREFSGAQLLLDLVLTTIGGRAKFVGGVAVVFEIGGLGQTGLALESCTRWCRITGLPSPCSRASVDGREQRPPGQRFRPVRAMSEPLCYSVSACGSSGHSNQHRTTERMALLLVLGSSPMVEGIPAFFAAARYGVGLIITMSAAFAASTIATYVVLSVYSATGLQRLYLGPIERYGEVISGAFIALIGVAFGLWSALP
jgi:hypothetical protein